MGHSCRKLLWDTLVGHSCGTLCGTLLWDTLVGHSCRTLLWDTLSCGTLSLVGHSCRTLLWDTLVGRSCGTLLWDTFVGHSCGTLLRAHGTNRTLACVLRARHARSPQRVARAWDKSHSRLHFAHSTRAISAEGCASSLQNERFVRDFLKNSHVKVCKTSVSYETSSKSQAETHIGAHTSRSPAKQFCDSSPSKQHPLTRQSQCDSDIHLYHNSQPHDSLPLPRIFPHPHV